mgnify:CR=1 FL=1
MRVIIIVLFHYPFHYKPWQYQLCWFYTFILLTPFKSKNNNHSLRNANPTVALLPWDLHYCCRAKGLDCITALSGLSRDWPCPATTAPATCARRLCRAG